MPTNDERREVAARLREEEYGLEYFTLMAILGFDRDAEPYFDGYHRCPERLNEDMRLRLADLIEPEERTCRMKPSENGVGLKQWGCSGCGGMTVSDLEPPFCSKCGARVKEEPDAD